MTARTIYQELAGGDNTTMTGQAGRDIRNRPAGTEHSEWDRTTLYRKISFITIENENIYAESGAEVIT
jgi:hypothetical protein